MSKKEWGKELRRLRKEKRQTQAQLIEWLSSISETFLGYKEADISRWENGHTLPAREVVINLAEALSPSSIEKLNFIFLAGYAPEEKEIEEILTLYRQGAGPMVKEQLNQLKKDLGSAKIADALILTLRRKEQQGKFIQKWKIQLCHPLPEHALVDVVNNRFPDGFGSVGTPCCYTPEGCSRFCWVLLKGEKPTRFYCQLYCHVEEEDFFKSLCEADLPSPEVWANFKEWKQKGGEYLKRCAKLYEQVGNEAEDKTNLRAVAGKEGLTLDFTRTIWRCAFWLGSGCFWYETPPGCGVFRYSGYRWSRPPLWEGGPEWPHLVDINKLEFPYSISSPEEELVELWLENTLIAGGSLEQVRKCRDVHHGMILSYKDSEQVLELLQLDRELSKLEERIRGDLDKALQEGISLEGGDVQL